MVEVFEILLEEEINGKIPKGGKMHLELFKNRRKKWQIRLVAGNGRILMHSEEYNRKASAVKTLRSIENRPRFALI